ncbi:MAG: hypothetical protein GF347_04420 [Candidatus Moranbacteria bacterium]|nr:hypothetical protein [Candidatus Moranbacteria bacterium]
MRRKIPYIVVNLLLLFLLIFYLLGFFESEIVSFLTLTAVFTMLFVSQSWMIIFLTAFSCVDIIEILGFRIYHWVGFFIFFILIYRLIRLIRKNHCRTCKWGDSKLKEFFSWFRFYWFNLKKEVLAVYAEGRYFLTLLGLLVLFSFIALFNAYNFSYSLKQTIVFILVVFITFLIYWWIKSKKYGLERVVKAFIFASFPILAFSIYQNVAFEKGLESFQIMAARPNGTFFEPDWLGMYLVFLIALVVPILLNQFSSFKKQLQKEEKREESFDLEEKNRLDKKALLEFLNVRVAPVWIMIILYLAFITLIISVARAAWVSVILMFGGFLIFSILSLFFKRINFKVFLNSLFVFLMSLVIFGLALGSVLVFNLTRFNLNDRFVSIFTREHIITVAERGDESFKINLEEIEYYKKLGYRVVEKMISDENIEIRESVYDSNWELVKQSPILGQGQGATTARRDYLYNASNVFWEWWISAGLGGLVVFVLLLSRLIIRNLQYLSGREKRLVKEIKRISIIEGESNYHKLYIYNQMIVMVIIGLVVANWFNSGIFFMPMWLCLAVIYGTFDKLESYKRGLRGGKSKDVLKFF